MKRFAAVVTAAIVLMTGPALAQDAPERVALVIGNGDYENAPVAETAVRDARAVAAALREAGWGVVADTDLRRAGMREVFERFATRAEDADQVLIYYSGHALRTGGDTYLAPIDQEAETLTEVLFDAVPFSLALRIAAQAEDQGIVFVDGAQLAGFEPRPFVEPGLAQIEPPDDVLVVSAAPPGQAIRRSPERDSRFARLIVDRFLQPGADVVTTANELGGPTWITGTADAGFVLAPEAEPLTEGEDGLAHEIELAYWRAAERSGRAADYRAYLNRYPSGMFAEFARERLEEQGDQSVPDEPEVDPALAAERALDLNRNRVRQVQQWLRVLGFEPGAVDGLLGPNTRSALRSWERAEGFDVNGYISRVELERLSAQGEAAVAERRRKEEEQRRVAEAEDEGYWAATGARGTAEGYRAYLERHPQGLHAEEARAALRAMADAEADASLRADRRAFRQAQEADTAEAYRDYIAENPEGAFYEDALARLDEIEGAERAEAGRERLARTENALGLNPADRLSLEQRLRSLGFEPGPLDGRFDQRTRVAIENYQDSRGIQATGYLDRPTVVGIVQETSDTRMGRGEQGTLVIDGTEVIRNLLDAFGGAIRRQ